MQTEEIEKVLAKISNQEALYIGERDFKVIEEMVEEGLIKPDNKGYTLTDYGKVIDVMGYETHQKPEPQSEPLKEINSNPIFSRGLIIFLAWILAVFSILSCVFYLSS